jgi:hypothetical protein
VGDRFDKPVADLFDMQMKSSPARQRAQRALIIAEASQNGPESRPMTSIFEE